jgi:hypothetical protein
VPIGGGGGGSVVVVPNGGTYELPLAPEGTSITLVREQYKGELWTPITITAVAPAGGIVEWAGVWINAYNNSIISGGNTFPLVLDSDSRFFVTFVSLGVYVGGYGPFQQWAVSGYFAQVP